MRPMIHARAILLLSGGCLTGAACGSDPAGGEPTLAPPDAGPDTRGTFATDAPSDTRDAAPACPKCSSDLHRVVDCDGHTVLTCPEDQGCDPVTGGCIGACESARANQSTIGCEYYGVQPDRAPLQLGLVNSESCYAVLIANTWATPVALAVDGAGVSYDVAGFARIPEGSGKSLTYKPLVDGKLPPGGVAILFLSDGNDLRCPDGVTPPTSGPTTVGTSRGNAFHVTTDHPVAAYDIFPYGGGASALTSASLLLPTSAWDDNYMAVDPYSTSRSLYNLSATQIVAQEDKTSVTLVPSRDVAAGPGVVAAPKNAATTYTLDKGEVLGFAELKGLTGSILKADKPIGVWSSTNCFTVDEWSGGACDSAHQQLFPIKALGDEYVAIRYRNRIDDREESPPWRIMAITDGTELSYDPEPPVGAPSSLNAGELATFRATGPFVVRSQDEAHPIYVSAHMTGAADVFSAGKGGVGDPELVNVVPARQFLSSYVFFTDPTYPETNLVLVRTRGTDRKFKDVTLDCAGVISGWQPLGTEYEYTRLDLVRHNFAPQNGCDNGRHEITSDAPFGLTVWGWGTNETQPDFDSEYVSYAYPAGASVHPINKVVANPVPK